MATIYIHTLETGGFGFVGMEHNITHFNISLEEVIYHLRNYDFTNTSEVQIKASLENTAIVLEEIIDKPYLHKICLQYPKRIDLAHDFSHAEKFIFKIQQLLKTRELSKFEVDFMQLPPSEDQELLKFELLKSILFYANSLNELTLHLYLNDDDVVEIANFLQKSSIKFLNLRYNYISDMGVEALCTVLGNESCELTSLNLSDNPITTTGAFALSKALTTNISLEKLFVSCGSIDNDGNLALLNALKSNKTLQAMGQHCHNRQSAEIILKELIEIFKVNSTFKYFDVSGIKQDQSDYDYDYIINLLADTISGYLENLRSDEYSSRERKMYQERSKVLLSLFGIMKYVKDSDKAEQYDNLHHNLRKADSVCPKINCDIPSKVEFLLEHSLIFKKAECTEMLDEKHVSTLIGEMVPANRLEF